MPKQKLFTTPKRNVSDAVKNSCLDTNAEKDKKDLKENKISSYKEIFGENAKLPKSINK